MTRTEDLQRIVDALAESRAVLQAIPRERMKIGSKVGGDPVTEVDTAIDARLRALLPRAGEGWLSEETADDRARLSARRVWIVDPLDGTREFVAGIPEWGISVALVEDGEAVAGGICNPPLGVTVVGAVGEGLRVEGLLPEGLLSASLRGARVLASRSEVARGEWERFSGASFHVVPVGSVAWKLALVAAGRADATFTLSPKNEWDVAAGAALVRAAGGRVLGLDGRAPRFNQGNTRLPGLLACTSAVEGDLCALLGIEPR
ncbi:MAG TPA: 3'(2'),5'-bisphosphate nucleotidase CysQ [Candidatus Polarisedimenticolaceae bacterium]|nr:3'(2'),5'-bisphosphate nucleotidase CysQ [Candidatus Polarisedimenticolaceae bacterium]